MQTVERPSPILSVEGVHKRFPLRSSVLRRVIGFVQAVASVTLDVGRGETVALVGESGSGKSTLGRCVLGLERPEQGTIRFRVDGESSIADMKFREIARHVQVVFQDPATSLSPRMTIGDIVSEPFVVHRDIATTADDAARRVGEALDAVGIPTSWIRRRIHQLSGGQRQRVAIARAIVLRPEIIVLDEPVSALDVSVQAQILRLLDELKHELGQAYLLISHDLGVVRSLADYVYVMYQGTIVEHGVPREILDEAHHPYTAALLEAEPSHPAWDPDESPASSGPVGIAHRAGQGGCPFAPRCPYASDKCVDVTPLLTPDADGRRWFACHHPLHRSQANA